MTEVADLLGAPVAKALLGKAVLADDSPFTTGGIGHLGTAPSSWAMKNCDTVLIVGSTMPWFEYYPKPGQARGVQIDMKPDRIGLRYPVEIGLVGDAKATLAGIDADASASVRSQLPSRGAKPDGGLEPPARRGRSDAARAAAAADGDQSGERSDRGRRGDLARLRREHPFRRTQSDAETGPAIDRHGHDGFDGAGPSFRHCGQLAYPNRQSVAIVGDGGFAMLMAEMTTAVQHHLPVKIIVLKNNSFAEVKFEQIELGNPSFGCELSPIDFVAFARACGADGFRCERPEEVRPAIQAALRSAKPALVEAVVDANEKPANPDDLRV